MMPAQPAASSDGSGNHDRGDRGRGRGGRGGRRGGRSQGRNRGSGRGGIGKHVSSPTNQGMNQGEGVSRGPGQSPGQNVAPSASLRNFAPGEQGSVQQVGKGAAQVQPGLHDGARTTSTTLSQMTKTRFCDLTVANVLKKAIAEVMGYQTATLVQERSIPVSLTGRDVLVKAKTGTGKTLVRFWFCFNL